MHNQALEARLAERFGRRYSLLTGNGTTALHVALEYARECMGCRSVALPEMICQTAVNSAVFSAMQLQFIDNQPNRLLADPEYWQSVVVAPEHQCLMVVDLFGYMHDDSALAGTGSFGYVVEDAAQAFFSTSPQRQAGTIGAASIVSFGVGKHVDIGGGGALLTDDQNLIAFGREWLQSLSASSVNHAMLRKEHYKQLLALERMALPRVHHVQEWHAIYRNHRALFLSAFDTDLTQKLSAALDGENQLKDAMLEKQQAILSWLASYPVSVIPYDDQCVAWRLPLFLDDAQSRNRLLAFLGALAIPVSTLFQPASILNAVANPGAVALHQHARLINVDLQKVDEKAFKKAMESYDWCG